MLNLCFSVKEIHDGVDYVGYDASRLASRVVGRFRHFRHHLVRGGVPGAQLAVRIRFQIEVSVWMILVCHSAP